MLITDLNNIKKKLFFTKKNYEDNIGCELNQLLVMVREKLMGTTNKLTTDDINKWSNGREKVNNQVWSDDGIIEGLIMAKKRMMMIMIGTGEEKQQFLKLITLQ